MPLPIPMIMPLLFELEIFCTGGAIDGIIVDKTDGTIETHTQSHKYKIEEEDSEEESSPSASDSWAHIGCQTPPT